ncbi:MAG: phosphotransferase [Anaerolineae bacterium]|nr:phosphotransferase [Anaerolineae bacterium]
MSETSSVVYRVTRPDGPRCALRIHRTGHKAIAWIESELTWLEAIRRETDLLAPRPIRTLGGDLLSWARLPDGEALPCALLEWVEGTACTPGTIQPEQVRQVGVYLARLHEFSRGYVPPPGFERPALDADGFFGEGSSYHAGEGERLFTEEQRAVFGAVEGRVRAVMAGLGRGRDVFGLIHADVIPQNVVFQGEMVGAVDFDECSWGYYLYDLAPMLWMLRAEVGYGACRAALIEGYETVSRLPEGWSEALETFMAARQVASCRWIARHREDAYVQGRAVEIIAARVEELRRYLDGAVFGERRGT